MIEEHISLKDFTTLKVGGAAEFFTVAATEAELIEAVQFAKGKGLAVHVIGEGSNILISDQGLPGLTIKNALSGWSERIDESIVYVTMGAGEVFDRAVAYTVSKGYWGLENLSHIPGSVGAAPVQNIGAYGVEIGERISTVKVFNIETEQFETLENETCRFGYRDSLFKHPDGEKYIITAVTCLLRMLPNPTLTYKDLTETFKDNTAPKISEIRDAVISIRSKKFPDWNQVGTAGSFFKNPIVGRTTYEKLRGEFPELPGFDVSDIDVKIPLAWILDHVCGLKGVEQGNVGTYQGQALVIVNNGKATASEVAAFADHIADIVFEKTGIKIEWEVTRMK
ncbi:UDP-N-acetylmuramate dehydrogenase [Candidatus Pacebacteria bacterium]|nr:UDP-N-acetylmuramate dehydrogenase [Candidatus Paceibacterota bacterium]